MWRHILICLKIKFLSFGANLKYLYSKIYQDRNSDYITGDFGLIANYSFISVGVSGFNLFGDFYDFEGKKLLLILLQG